MNKKLIINYYNYTAFGLNIISLIFYILIVFNILIVATISSILYILTFLFNLGLIILNFRFVNRTDKLGGRWIKNFSWIYLVICFISILLIIMAQLGHFIAEAPPYFIDNIVLIIYSIIGYLLIYCFGIFICYYNIKNLKRNEAWNF